MENPAKALIAILFACLCACGQGDARDARAPSPESGARSDTTAIGKGLFVDARGNLLLKVRNRGLDHPSKAGALKDSLFLSRVYDVDGDSLRSLTGLLDTSTFERENPDGTCFSDASRLYVYASNPHPVQFSVLPRGKERYLGSGKEYLVVRGMVYHLGVRIEGLDSGNLTLLSLQRADGRGRYEFLADGKRLFIGAYPLDAERLRELDGLSGSDRLRLEKRIGVR